MSIPTLELCRKRKRRPKVYDFQSFGEAGYPINPKGPFRENIRLFLRECAEREDYCLQGGMPISCTLLHYENKGLIVPLYTIEEDVQNSQSPYCDHCRSSGWNNHLVSKRKYHLIIPMDSNWIRPLDDDILNLHTHLLHGLMHCNGFGHLICINGIEGGSKFLCGREIMDLWDRICSNLLMRKVTIEDVSKRRSMDLRLLHGVAYGHPWFGKWGYEFSRGSFGVKEHHYSRAIEVLCSLELDQIMLDFSSTNCHQEIKKIIRYYRDMSETKLVTLKDILKFMLTINSCASVQKSKNTINLPLCFPSKSSTRTVHHKLLAKEKKPRYKNFSTEIANTDSRWPAKRLEYAANVIVDALRENGSENMGTGGMTRQEVRDAARLHIGDTGLIDYVLKSLNSVIVGNHIVCRSVNSSSRILEYTIQKITDEARDGETVTEVFPINHYVPNLKPGADILTDATYFYRNVLLAYPKSGTVELATRVIIDSKHFVKKWMFRDEDDHMFRFICRLNPISLETELPKVPPPGEVVVLPLHSTVLDLKQAAEDAFKDTYCVTEQLIVTEIKYMGYDLNDDDVLFGAIESGSEIWVRGIGIDMENQLRSEGGLDSWVVKCECGARDDDGERMVACDICEVWQHTRCCGIEDNETVPPLFVCGGCCLSLIPARSKPAFEFGSFDSVLMLPSSEHMMGLEC